MQLDEPGGDEAPAAGLAAGQAQPGEAPGLAGGGGSDVRPAAGGDQQQAAGFAQSVAGVRGATYMRLTAGVSTLGLAAQWVVRV